MLRAPFQKVFEQTATSRVQLLSALAELQSHVEAGASVKLALSVRRRPASLPASQPDQQR